MDRAIAIATAEFGTDPAQLLRHTEGEQCAP